MYDSLIISWVGQYDIRYSYSSIAEKNYSPITIVRLSDSVIHTSHSTIQYVKPPAKIWTPGLAGLLATARTPSTAGKPVTPGPPATGGPPATACSKGIAENPTNTLATPGTSEKQRDQLQETIRNLKNASNSKNACHCLDASNSSDTSNNSNASNKQH